MAKFDGFSSRKDLISEAGIKVKTSLILADDSDQNWSQNVSSAASTAWKQSNQKQSRAVRCNDYSTVALRDEIRTNLPGKYIIIIWLTVFLVVSWTTAFLKFSLLSEPPIPTTKFSLLFVTVQGNWSAHPPSLSSARPRRFGNLRKIFVILRWIHDNICGLSRTSRSVAVSGSRSFVLKV